MSGDQMRHAESTDPLALSADAELREVLDPSRVAPSLLSGTPAVDAVVAAATAAGSPVSPARAAGLAREKVTDVAEVARRLGVPARPVLLHEGWWRGESGVYIVRDASGEPAAAIPVGNSYVLVEGVRRRRIDRAVAAELQREAWAITPRLPNTPGGMRQVVGLALGSGSRQDLGLALLAAVGIALFGLAVPVAAGVVIGELVPGGQQGRTVALGVLLVLVAICAAGVSLLAALLVQRLTTRVDSRAVAVVLDRLLRLPLAFFREHAVGDLVQRVQGLDTVASVVTTSALRILSSLLLVLSGMAVMAALDVGLAGAVCLVLLLSALAAGLVMVRQVRHQERYVDRSLRLSATSLSLFAGIAKIRVAGAEGRMESLWTVAFARQQQAARDVARTGQLLGMVAAGVPILVTITVVVGSISRTGDVGLGTFTAFVAAAGQAAGALAALLPPLALVVGSLPVLRAIGPVLQAEPEPLGEIADVQVAGGIELVNVSCTYAGGPEVLSGVSVRIEPGEFVAVVGPSGSGKTTLVRVLLGLETASAGEVLFDGRPLDRLGVDGVRRQIGVVTQTPQLATGTILDNITGGAPCTEDEAWRAAAAAGIEREIREMPMGMRTFVSDGASSFSGGQKQRILLARALIRQPRILVLDEATSALDARTQEAVAQSMRALGATRIVVAQRLSTIRDADRILVLDRGQLVEEGSYPELMAAGGVFWRLASPQQ